jgi:hypothetical protein
MGIVDALWKSLNNGGFSETGQRVGFKNEGKPRDKYSSKVSKVEVLQLLIVGIKGTEEYMEKVRRELGI